MFYSVSDWALVAEFTQFVNDMVGAKLFNFSNVPNIANRVDIVNLIHQLHINLINFEKTPLGNM
jgi:hypothetical protein